MSMQIKSKTIKQKEGKQNNHQRNNNTKIHNAQSKNSQSHKKTHKLSLKFTNAFQSPNINPKAFALGFKSLKF